jgi:hypothetical protein
MILGSWFEIWSASEVLGGFASGLTVRLLGWYA